MPRPPFHLTDEQASTIARGVADLDARIPLDARTHRPFVRAFIALVRTATGNLYSPTIYRRLLDAYVPTRRPSMTTLAAERERAGRDVQPLVVATGDGTPVAAAAVMSANQLDSLRDVVADAIDEKLARVIQTVEYAQNAQLEFYQHQLEQTEQEAKNLRAKVAALGAELAATRQSAEQYQAEAQAGRETVARQLQAIEQLSQNADELRKFALMGIDDARSETRQWKERCAQLEIQRHKDAQAMDTMRRATISAASASPTRNPNR
jgi:hypothetical protein